MELQHLWLYFGLGLLIAEIVTPGFFISIFSIGALAASLFAFFNHDLKTQFIVFLIFNILAFIYLRPLLLKLLYNKNSIKKTNIDNYIGKTAIVIESINNEKNTGRIKIVGESWRAVSTTNTKIKENQNVLIENISGNKFYVSIINEEK